LTGFGAARSGFAGAVCEAADDGQAAGAATRAGAGRAAAEGRFKIFKIKNQLQRLLPATAVAPFAAVMADVGLVADLGLVGDRGRSS
jgi:hypothetical protein